MGPAKAVEANKSYMPQKYLERTCILFLDLHTSLSQPHRVWQIYTPVSAAFDDILGISEEDL